jgi:tape measure domain-containing protein
VADEDFRIRISQQGAERVGAAVEGIGRSARRTAVEVDKSVNVLKQFRNVLVALSGIRAAIGFIELADSAQRMSNSMRTATGSVEEYNRSMDYLREISRETRTDVEANATVYSRLLKSTQGLAFTTQDLERVMKGLTLSTKVGGATAMEARNALIQFSQSLASGALRGDELRSVSEQLPALAKAIGKEFGVAGGALLAFAKENPGILQTEKVLRGVIKGVEDMEKQFAVMGPTMMEGLTAVRNEFVFFLQDLESSTGIMSAVAWGFIAIANSLNVLIPLLVTAAVAYGGGALTKFASDILMANNVLIRLIMTGRLWTATMTAINAVMMRNPLALLAIAAAALAYAFITLYQNSEVLRMGINGILEVLGTMWTAITLAASAIYEVVDNTIGWEYATEIAGAAIYILAHAIGGLLMTALSALLVLLAGTVKWMNQLGWVSDETTKLVTDAATKAEKAAADWYVYGKSTADATDKTAGLGESFRNLRTMAENGMNGLSGYNDEMDETAKKTKTTDDAVNKVKRSMWEVGLSAEEAAAEMGSFNEVTNQWVSISGEAYNGLNGMASGLAGVANAANSAANAIRNVNAAAASGNSAGGSTVSGGNATTLRGHGYSGTKPMNYVSMADLPARASGGPVSAGKTYLVGENGPEMFTPNESGSITSSRKTAEAMNMVADVEAKLAQFWKEIKANGGFIAGPNISRLFNLQRAMQDAKSNLQYSQQADAIAARIAENKRIRKEFKNGFQDDGAINLPGFENVGAAPKIDFQTLTPWQGGKDYGTHDPNGIGNGSSGGSSGGQSNGAQTNVSQDNSIKVVMNVTATDAGSFRQNQAQLEGNLLAMVERAQRRKMRK